MSDINQKNYPGANVVVVGRAAGSPETKTIGKSEVTELSVFVNNGYKNRDGEWVETSTNVYTIQAAPDWAEQNWPVINKGDLVRLDDARLEFHAYNTKQGEARTDARLRFGTVVVVESKGGGSNRGGSTRQAEPDYSDATPF